MKKSLTNLFCIFSLIIGIVFSTVPAIAEQKLNKKQRQELEEIQKEKNIKNFTGWEGILLYCDAGEQSNPVLKKICEKTYANADFLSGAAKIKLMKENDAFNFGFSLNFGNLLPLEVVLTATSYKPKSPFAIYVDIRAYTSYSGPVEKLYEIEKNEYRKFSRSGHLLFWERSVIGASSGNGTSLIAGISEGIEQHLKQFFADYMKAQQ